MKYIVFANLDAENSDYEFIDIRIRGWRFSWRNNKILALTKVTKLDRQMGDVFQHLESYDQLGLLVDILMLASDITVSADSNYRLYQADENTFKELYNPNIGFDVLIQRVHRLRADHSGSNAGEEWPVRIHKNTTHTIKPEKKELALHIFQQLSATSIVQTNMKLVNYWRRGYDLENLSYYDEAFLAFYKILEYFGKKPLTEKSAVERVKKEKVGIRRKALRIAYGGGIENPDKFLIDMISDFIGIRNNFDVAHMRIRPVPENRDGALYFTYYLSAWGEYSDIQELSRFFILKHMGVKDIELYSDGGLLHLRKKSAQP